MFLLKMQRDQLAGNLHSKGLKTGTVGFAGPTGCRIGGKALGSDGQLEQLNQLHYWLELLGDPLISVEGIGALFYFLFATLTFYIFTISFFVKQTSSRAEWLSFILDSQSEKNSARIEISRMVEGLIESNRYFEYLGADRLKDQLPGHSRSTIRRYSYLFNYRAKHTDFERREQNSIFNKLYLSILTDCRLQDLVQPSI